MSEHFIITADRGHLRVFQQQIAPGQQTPGLQEVTALDFPAGVRPYSDRDTDAAGRFQSSRQPSRGSGAPTARSGMSIDERLPMQREEERRETRDVAETIESFLREHSDATWDFAAGPEIHHDVLEALSPEVRARLHQAVTKDLIHQPDTALRQHFDAAKVQNR